MGRVAPAEPAAPETPPAGRGIPALDPVPPVALVLLGVTSIQFGAALAATLFDRLGPSGTSLLRLGFAAIVLVVAWRPRPRAHPWRHLRLAVAFGLTLGAMNLLFYEALDRVPLGIAVTVEFLGPIGVATALSRRRLDYVWVVLAVCGVVLLTAPGSGGAGIDGLGLAFALAAAACWAGYILLAERAGRVFDAGEGLSMAMVVAALIPVIPGIAEAGSALLTPSLLLSGFAVALLSSVIPYSLETEALRRMPARVFGVLMSLEPAVAALAGFLVLGQGLGVREIAAIALVVAASVGVTRGAATQRVEATLDA